MSGSDTFTNMMISNVKEKLKVKLMSVMRRATLFTEMTRAQGEASE